MLEKVVPQLLEVVVPAAEAAVSGSKGARSVSEAFAHEAYVVPARGLTASIRTVAESMAAEEKAIAQRGEEFFGMAGSKPVPFPEPMPVLEPMPVHLATEAHTAIRFGGGEGRVGGSSLENVFVDEASPFAQLIHEDAAALEAASYVEKPAIGFSNGTVRALATDEETQKNALQGTLAFLKKGGANNDYSRFLEQRFGSL